MSAEILGVDKLLKKLNRIGGDSTEVLYKSLQKQGEFVKGNAKDLCPVDLGALRQSIHKTTKRTKNEVTATVHTNMEYAAYVEFGTGPVGEASKPEGAFANNVEYKQDGWLGFIPDVGPRWIEGMEAQPYMYPALKDNEQAIIDNIKEDILAEIRRLSR